MNLQTNLGIAIKELRTNLGLSQEKFALSIEMDRTYLASVEAGKRNLSLANIEKIARGLNTNVSELFAKAESYNWYKAKGSIRYEWFYHGYYFQPL